MKPSKLLAMVLSCVCLCGWHTLRCMHPETHQESSKSPVTIDRTVWEEAATQNIPVGGNIG